MDRKVLSEDFTSFFAGRHVTTLSTCPWLLGLTTPWTSFFLLLAPGLVRIHLHDPGFYIFNQNPAGPPMHNVHFVKYVFLPTEQAETYLKKCVLINYSTYICLGLFGWKENMIFKETLNLGFLGHFD